MMALYCPVPRLVRICWTDILTAFMYTTGTHDPDNNEGFMFFCTISNSDCFSYMPEFSLVGCLIMLIPVSWNEPWAAVDDGLWYKLSLIIWLLWGIYIGLDNQKRNYQEIQLVCWISPLCKKESLFFVIAVLSVAFSIFRTPSAKIKTTTYHQTAHVNKRKQIVLTLSPLGVS